MAWGPERPLPLSIRLTATYALLVAATLLVVGAIVMHLTRDHLQRELEVQLSSAANSFQAGPAREIRTESDVARASRDWLASRSISEEQYAAVRTSEGQVLLTGGIDLRSVRDGRRLLQADTSRWWTIEGPDAPIRALTVPLLLGESQVGTLVVGAEQTRLEETLSTLLSGVTWASLIGLAFAAFLGFASMRRTLRPLGRMADEVDDIQRTGDLSRRVAPEGPPDEVVRLGDAFDRLLEKLEDSLGMQRRFLSDASHELRTPLTVARGQLELLQGELQDPDQSRSLSLAVEELDRMRRIVDDLLLLARLDEGISLKEEPVEVELVVREALLRGMLLAPRRNVVEVEPGLLAMADPERLLQVLTNLITNSVQHAGEDATLTLRAHAVDSEIAIEVSDDGRGISSSDLSKIFDRLYRGASSGSSGVGLGLSIASSLTEAMGGRIEVGSEVARGTTFRVILAAAPPL
ncbi:MAG: ATP-binding protein [Actinomycetota bacterium]